MDYYNSRLTSLVFGKWLHNTITEKFEEQDNEQQAIHFLQCQQKKKFLKCLRANVQIRKSNYIGTFYYNVCLFMISIQVE